MNKIKNIFSKISNKIKKLFLKIKKWLIKRFNNNRDVSIIAGVLVIIFIIIVAILIHRRNVKIANNEIYVVTPAQAQKLYDNFVDISCKGDLYLDIKLDSEYAVAVKKLDDNTLLDVVFSYLDKKGYLEVEELKVKTFNNAVNKLFYYKFKDFVSKLDNYEYNGYIYNYVDGGIVRTEAGEECSSDVEYISMLYGFSYNDNILSLDVAIGYLKDGILYDLSDNKLGEYTEGESNLVEFFVDSSYYRYDFKKRGNKYRLYTVQWKSKA